MPVDLSNWLEDSLPDPVEGWEPEMFARRHVERLWGLRANLHFRLSAAKQNGKKIARQWDNSLWYNIQSWCRVTGDDPHQGIEISDTKVDLSIDTHGMAFKHRAYLLEEGSRAVTWTLRLGHRPTANRMGFYLDRELLDLDRIFLS